MNLRSESENRPSAPSRRRFLGAGLLTSATAVVAGAGVGVGLLGERAPATAGESRGETRLSIDPGLDLFRVRMQMDVKGNVNLVDDPLVPEGKKRMLPITANLALDYEERLRRPSRSEPGSEALAAERCFHEAVSTSRLSRREQRTELRDSVSPVIARRDQLPETIYSNDEYLTHEEIDLLRTPIASAAIDRLVPQQMMRVGEKTPVSSPKLASFFNLSAIAKSEVEIELVSIEAGKAKLQMRGKIEGSVSGVPTRLQVLGKLTLDRRIGAVTWAAVAIHETREIGKAEPGFDVQATIRMVRKPLSQVQVLPATAAEIALEQPVPEDRLLVSVASEHLGVEGLIDRRWRVMQDVAGGTVMRMIENDQSIAQLNLRPLSRLPEGKQWTLAAFQNDVRKTLGERFSEFIESHEGMTESGLRLLRVVAAGQVEGVPIQWIMMHVSDDSRHRIMATWTMDGESAPHLAGSDIQLAASLRLTDPAHRATESASEASKASEKPGISLNAPTGEVESVASAVEVDSPSDIQRR